MPSAKSIRYLAIPITLTILLMAILTSAAPSKASTAQAIDRTTQRELRWFLSTARAPILRTLRQWAEQELVIPEGRFKDQLWRADRQPYAAIFFDAIDSGRWTRIAAVGCVQSGKSLHCFVAPTLYHLFEHKETSIDGLPTMDLSHDKWAKELLPVIQANPRLRDLLPTHGPGARGGTGNLESITFRHGPTLKFMSAGGGDEKRSSFTSRVVICTELDKMDTAGETSRETDPVAQMEARSLSWDLPQRRWYGECTVSIPTGRIWQEYTAGTASRIVCPCSHCQCLVTPEREHLVGWREAETEVEALRGAHFACPACGHAISDDERIAMNQAARLVHRGQEITPDGQIVGEPADTLTLGFRWNAFNNLFWSPGAIGVAEWHALRAEDSESAEKEMLQFYWVQPYESPDVDLAPLDPQVLRRRMGASPKGEIPKDAEHLTLGLDLGKRVGYWVLIAWLPEARGHVADYGTIEIPSDDLGEQRALALALKDFQERIEQGWNHPGHASRVPDQVWIDARWQGGHAGDRGVYDFCISAGTRYRPYLGFGDSVQHSGRYNRPAKLGGKCKFLGDNYHIDWEAADRVHVVKINADYWKTQVRNRLAQRRTDRDGLLLSGSIELYAGTNTEHTTFAKHLAAEEPREIFVEGRGRVTTWVQHSRANHLGDAMYAAATAGHFRGVRVVPVARPAPPASPRPIGVRTQPFSYSDRPFLITDRR